MSSHSERSGLGHLADEIEEVTDDISDVRIFDIPVLLIFALLIVIVALQFFTRYVLNNSLEWTEEIARYLLILLGFIGSITCIRKGSHIYLEFFYRYLSSQTVKALSVTVELLTLAFFAYLGLIGLELAERTQAMQMISIDQPKNLVYYLVAAACFIAALIGFWRLLKIVRTPADSLAADKLDNIDID